MNLGFYGFSGPQDATQVVTPQQIVANQNDYSPAFQPSMDGMAGLHKILRLSTDASRDITGVMARRGGAVVWIWNVGAQNIVLKHQSTNSQAQNRFLSSTGLDVTITPDGYAMLTYDATTQRWRL